MTKGTALSIFLFGKLLDYIYISNYPGHSIDRLIEQAQLGTNNAEGREPGEEVMQNPGLPSWLAGSSPNFEWKLTNHDHPRCSATTITGP